MGVTIMKLNKKTVSGMLLCMAVSLPVFANNVYKADETHAVQFQKGKSGAVVKGKVTGNHDIDYTLTAKQGQLMEVKMESAWPHPFFNVISPSGETLFVGMDSGDTWKGKLPASGRYAIRIYQKGNAKDAGETHAFTLSLKITQ